MCIRTWGFQSDRGSLNKIRISSYHSEKDVLNGCCIVEEDEMVSVSNVHTIQIVQVKKNLIIYF